MTNLTSSNNDSLKKEFLIKIILRNIGSSLKYFFCSSNKSKLAKLLLILLCYILTIKLVSYAFYTNYQSPELTYTSFGYSLEESKDVDLDTVNKNFSEYINKDSINDIIKPYTVYINMNTTEFKQEEYLTEDNVGVNINEDIKVENFVLPDTLVKEKLILGRLPENDFEAVVDKTILNSLNKSRYDNKYTVDNLINKEITIKFRSFTIVGVSDTSSTAVYVNSYMVGQLPLLYCRYTFNSNSQNDRYELVLGSGFTKSYSEEKQAIVNIDSFSKTDSRFYNFDNGYISSIDDDSKTLYKIVGYFKSNDGPTFIPNQKLDVHYWDWENAFNIYNTNKKSIYYLDVNITSGREPNTESEIVLSDKTNFSIGDSVVVALNENDDAFADNIKHIFTVVGFSSDIVPTDALVSGSYAYNSKLNNITKDTVFLSDNPGKLKDRFSEINLNIVNNETAVLDRDSNINMSAKKSALTYVIVLFIIVICISVFEFYLNLEVRVRDIKEKSLKLQKKSRVYFKVLSDLIVFSVFTSCLGVLIGYISFKETITTFSGVSTSIPSIELANLLVILLVVIVVVINLTSGLIILRIKYKKQELLKKTELQAEVGIIKL